jgi:hypothetical protein
VNGRPAAVPGPCRTKPCSLACDPPDAAASFWFFLILLLIGVRVGESARVLEQMGIICLDSIRIG